MTQTQKTRLVAVALAGVALIVFFILMKALMMFFGPKRPPIIISGGSIIIRTLGGNAWDHQTSTYTTHQAVNPSSVQTTGTLDAQHVPYDLPSSGLQPNGWSISITTMAYHVQEGKQHNG
jgi:small neutral amino acid transporter SnatA (MarC family)